MFSTPEENDLNTMGSDTDMLDIFTTENAVAFLTLTALEIVLGIDNVIFIAILAEKLPQQQRDLARKLGLGLAVISRVLLLLGLA